MRELHLRETEKSFTDKDLVYLPVSKLLTLYSRKQLSPVEFMQSLIASIEHGNPKINAISDQYIEESIKAAKYAEKIYMNSSAAPRALEGIPFSVKDSLYVKNKKCTAGSKTKLNSDYTESEPCVDRLLESGAIMHAVSYTHLTLPTSDLIQR